MHGPNGRQDQAGMMPPEKQGKAPPWQVSKINHHPALASAPP